MQTISLSLYAWTNSYGARWISPRTYNITFGPWNEWTYFFQEIVLLSLFSKEGGGGGHIFPSAGLLCFGIIVVVTLLSKILAPLIIFTTVVNEWLYWKHFKLWSYKFVFILLKRHWIEVLKSIVIDNNVQWVFALCYNTHRKSNCSCKCYEWLILK